MAPEFEYCFKRVKVRGGFLGMRFTPDYQQDIDQMARQGWRFVQAFAPSVEMYGVSTYADLIFERTAV